MRLCISFVAAVELAGQYREKPLEQNVNPQLSLSPNSV